MTGINGEPKKTYIPSQNKRWEVSNDPESRDRINALLSVKKHLSRELSYQNTEGEIKSIPIGISLFGSLSKGKMLGGENGVDADVDLWMFYDIEELQFHVSEMLESNPKSRFADLYQMRLKELELENKGYFELPPVFDSQFDWIVFTRYGKAARLAIEDLIVDVTEQTMVDNTNLTSIKTNYNRGFKIGAISQTYIRT